MASKHAGVWTAAVAAAVALAGGVARAESKSVGTFAVGDLELRPGMTLHVIRPDAARTREVGTLRVLEITDSEVRVELMSGSAELQSGDRIESEGFSRAAETATPHTLHR